MTNHIINEINEIAKSLKRYRFQNELIYYQSQNDNKFIDKINNLNRIINELEDKSNDIILQNNENNARNKIRNVFSEADKIVYKKPWNKLPEFHKNVKIKEFVSNYYKNDEVEKMLLDAVGKNELKKDHVVYDQNLCKIVDIPILKNIDGKFKLEYTKKRNTRTKK